MEKAVEFFATGPRGTERVLADELRELGAEDVQEAQAGASFRGTVETAYRVCLWSRVANRVLYPLGRFRAATPEALYAGVRAIDWAVHLRADGSLAVDFHAVQSAITHTHFGALKVKDAIVDRFREALDVRPSVDLERPDVRVNVYVFRDEARVSLDLSGESLHRRGYRAEGGPAPLKENLAAAILLRARWPEVARAGGAFVDPMCGSGTLPIEAAWMAGDVAPGLLRTGWGFTGWKGHDRPAWDALLAEARTRREAGLAKLPPVVGYDADPGAVRTAIANVERAGLRGRVHIEKRDLDRAEARGSTPGFLAVNPPYGERMGETQDLVPLYARLGDLLRTRFAGWRAAVFTGNPGLAPQLRLRPRRSYDLFNGAIPCKLLVFKLASEEIRERVDAEEAARTAETGSDRAVETAQVPPRRKALHRTPRQEAEHAPASRSEPLPRGPGGEMLANRLRKNLRHLGRWARRNGIDCYRLYDADLPEYALAVDLYRGEKLWAHVQEYAAPAKVDPDLARARRQEAVQVLQEVLELPPEQVFCKRRSRQRGAAQYERQGTEGRFYEVEEQGCRFLVNFTDYLDTGLFLDHRITRAKLREKARGRRFLNLFGYTGTATVYAADGGALSTTTVDLSQTYLAWARRNLECNGFGEAGHDLVQADCLAWLEAESGRRSPRQYGLIFLDPPTFSNSKRMAGTFDVQRDHAEVIAQAMKLLEPGGELLFSTNRRNFRMAFASPDGVRITDLTGATLPKDFERNPNIHHCWELVRTV